MKNFKLSIIRKRNGEKEIIFLKARISANIFIKERKIEFIV